MNNFEVISIILQVVSIIISIVLSSLIYWLQTKHQKEIQKLDKKIKKKQLENKANIFLIDNAHERCFLPLCIIAANINKQRQHKRNIYTNFNRCSKDLQNEILKQANFDLKIIEKTNWVSHSFEKLKFDIELYNLGRNVLYDGEKYFHKGFEKYGSENIEINSFIFKKILPLNKKLGNYPIDLFTYIEEYFILTNDSKTKSKPIPPIDMVWNSQNLGTTDEKIVCFWVIEIVQSVLINLYNKYKKGQDNSNLINNLTDAQPKTYEDKYYNALYWLYLVYN